MVMTERDELLQVADTVDKGTATWKSKDGKSVIKFYGAEETDYMNHVGWFKNVLKNKIKDTYSYYAPAKNSKPSTKRPSKRISSLDAKDVHEKTAYEPRAKQKVNPNHFKITKDGYIIGENGAYYFRPLPGEEKGLEVKEFTIDITLKYLTHRNNITPFPYGPEIKRYGGLEHMVEIDGRDFPAAQIDQITKRHRKPNIRVCFTEDEKDAVAIFYNAGILSEIVGMVAEVKVR